MSTPKVSVLIPTYNYAHFLDEAIQSVLDQTFTDFELIIVDNCSTDGTDAVVKKYLTDSRVHFRVNEANIGLVGNWNRCLDYAKGEYIKLLCADDKFRPRLLETFVAVMDQHPDVSIISSYSHMFGHRNHLRETPFTGLVAGRVVREALLTAGVRNLLRNPSVVMFRMAHIKKIGSFCPELHQSVDFDFYMRLLTVGDCYIVPESLSCVRSHPNTQTAILRKKKHIRILEKYRFMSNIKAASAADTEVARLFIDDELKARAVRSAAVMYEVLPKLHKKENRIFFKKAFQIGRSEGVLFTPLLHYFKLKYISRLLGMKKLSGK